MNLTEKVLAELPGTIHSIAEKLDLEKSQVKEVMFSSRREGITEIQPGTMRVWQRTGKRGGYKIGKRKYTRRKKPKRVGILLQIEMLESRVTNIEQLLGIEQ